jgi:hypothetical protein
VFPIDGRIGGYFRVALEPKQHAWIAEVDTRPGGAGASAFARAIVRPPEIVIEGGAVRAVRGSSARFEGWASHEGGVRDLMVFVGDKKVAYVPQRTSPPGERLDFSLELPLSEGANEVVFVARHDADVATSEAVFVRATSK